MNMPTDITDPLKKPCTAEVVFIHQHVEYIISLLLY